MLNLIAIGEYIAKKRNEQNLSQQQLADTLYVTHQAVSKWENGKALPNIEIIMDLTKLFHITIDDLLYCDAKFNHSFETLLTLYPRNYVVNQLVQGKFKEFNLSENLYLLSRDEREIVMSHIMNRSLAISFVDLFPYLTIIERRLILNHFTPKELHSISHMLSHNELKLLEENHEH